MFIGNDLIEAIPVHLDKITQPGYLGQFKRVLKEKHAALLQQAGNAAEFLVFNMSAAANSHN